MSKSDHSIIRLTSAMLLSVAALIVQLLLAACTTDAYESGEGKYSHLTAEFGMAHTVAKGKVDVFTTDGGRNITLASHATASWATTPDSLYRSLLYFYDNEDGVSPFSIAQVFVMRPAVPKEGEKLSNDPLTLSSLWQSDDGKWLNMRLDIKSGEADDPKAVHNVGVVKESVADGAYKLRIVHARNGRPEYYTSTVYVSIPVDEEMIGRRVDIAAMTYNGEKTLSVEVE